MQVFKSRLVVTSMSSEAHAVWMPKRLVDEAERRGLDLESFLISAVVDALKLDPEGEAVVRVEIAERFMEEARRCIDEGNAVQASEKLYKVAEECIKALAIKFKAPEAEEAKKEGRWWTKLLAKAARTLSTALNDPEIRYAWEDAYDLHVWMHETVYGIEHVKTSVPTIEQLLAKTRRLIQS